MDTSRLTRASDVAAPEREKIVELKHLKTTGGDPVVVLVRGMEGVEMLRQTQSVPGFAPKDITSPQAKRDAIANQELNVAVGRPLIERAVFMVDGVGDLIPAFHFGAPRHPSSFDGALLHMEDFNDLTDAVIATSGYVGGAVEGLRFPDDQEGIDVGPSAVAAVGAGGAPAAQPDSGAASG